MTTKKTVLLVLLLILSTALTIPNDLLLPAHAASPAPGLVCLADPTTAAMSPTTPCPTSAPLFNGVKSQQIKVGVYVQNSYNVTGFDIDLYTNHTFLTPVGVELSGTIVPGSTTILLECIQDIVKAGNAACAPYDSGDTLHLTLAGAVGQHTNPGTTGLLFTAIYNITGITATGGIPLGYQNGTRVPITKPPTPPGCVGSSPGVGKYICVTIAGGSGGADPETAQASTFDNSNSATTLPYVTETTSSKIVGPVFPSVSGTATINATAQNLYGSCTPFCPTGVDNVTFTAVPSAGLTATISSPTFCSTGGTRCSVTLSASASTAGNYSVTVFGTYATADVLGNLDTLVANITLIIVVDDFGFAVNPTIVYFVAGSTGSTTITVSSVNGFAGSVAFSTGTIIGTPPLTVSYSSSPVTLSRGQILIINATFSGPTSSASYSVQFIKATSGTRSKTSSVLSVKAISGDATSTTVACTPGIVNSNSASSCTATVTDTASSPTTPGGAVYLTSNGQGNFTPISCSLASLSASSASCGVSYTPTQPGKQTVVASYAGDTGHGTSQNKTGITIVAPTTTSVKCSSVFVGYTSSCIVKVLDTSFSPTVPTGTVSFTTNSTGTFTPSTNQCTLSPGSSPGNATCGIAYLPTVSGHHLISGSYSGDSSHSASSNPFSLLVSLVPTTTSIKCSPTSLGAPPTASTNCSAIVLDTSSNPTTPTGSLMFGTNATGFGIFTPASGICNLTPGSSIGNATCSVSYAPSVGGPQAISGSYGGDTVHASSVSGQVVIVVTGFRLFASPSQVIVNTLTAGNSTITAVAYGGFAGSVSLTKAVPSGIACSLSPTSITLGTSQSSTLSCSSPNYTNYNVNVTGTSGSLTFSITVKYQITDFLVSTSAATITVAQGAKGSVNVTLTGENGFSGTVTLTLSLNSLVPPSSQPKGSLSMTSVPFPTSTNTVVVFFNVTVGPNAVPNTYSFMVNSTSGKITDSHTIVVTVPRPDFSITASPTNPIVILPGQTSAVTVTVGAIYGYNGSVTFSYSTSSGLTCTFSRSSVRLLPGGSNTTSLSCGGSASSTSYVVSVTGTPVETYAIQTQQLSSSQQPVYSVVDFTIASTPSGITVNTGEVGHAQINVTWTKGYAGTVTLKATPSNSALTVTIPGTITQSGVVTLNVTSSTAGSYSILVVATSGTVSHNLTITVTEIAVQNATILGLDPTVFYSIVGVVVLAAVAAGIFLLRRKPKLAVKK